MSEVTVIAQGSVTVETTTDIIEVTMATPQPIEIDVTQTGRQGAAGKSAYQIWLDLGNSGTEQDFLNSLRSASSGGYLHTQATPAQVWTINHNLGYYPAGIRVKDTQGAEWLVEPEYINDNTIQVNLGVAFAGTAYIS